MQNIRFPKRFEIEGIDPYAVKCKIVQYVEGHMFEQVLENILVADSVINLRNFMGPFADKHEGEWCVRFECKNVYKRLGE